MKNFLLSILLLFIAIFGFSQAGNDSIYNFVETQPMFVGGIDSLNQYIIQNIEYPEDKKSDSLSGIVYVSFVVNIDGSLSNIEILRSLGEGFDEAALHLVESMPKWIPAEHNGNKVRAKTNLPIKFKFNSYGPDTTRVYYNADVMPEYPGGIEALERYLMDSLRIPDHFDNTFYHEVVVEFIVERSGQISGVEVAKSCHPLCDEEAKRLVSNMPSLNPGMINGIPVKVAFNMPVDFNTSDIYTVVEEMPEYTGGMGELMKFLGENLKYPKEAKRKGIQGRVFVNFVVEPDGSVTNIRVLKGIGGGCDEEAVRVISLMPKWIPGTQRGKPIAVSYNLPVKFTLQRGKY